MVGYFLMSEGVANDQLMAQVKASRELDLKVAAASPFRKIDEMAKFKSLIDNLNHFAVDFNYGENWNGTVEAIKAKLEDGMQTLAARLLTGTRQSVAFKVSACKDLCRNDQRAIIEVICKFNADFTGCI